MFAWVVYHRRIILTIIILLLQSRSFAQLSAAFTASPVAGCSPIVVQFTDQSAGSPVQWKWDLGNGVTSFLQNPSTTYFNPGSYTVKLVVRNGNGADSIVKNQYITVFPAPVINFTASDTIGCFPMAVHFTDMSAPGNGSVASWLWDFGDGSTSTTANPSHTYTTPGNFTVTLKITNTNGCFKILSRPQYIEVTAGVVSAFTNITPAQCAVPVTVSFTNTSSGPGVLNYTWNFGDGTGSNQANPVHTYSNPGTYTVILVTESSQGCRDSLVKPNLITVGAIASHFTSPDSVCLNQPFLITNTTTPPPLASQWNFGDGTSSTTTNPVKTYTSVGTFNIKLVNTFSGCIDSISKSILVRPGANADFSVNQAQSCQVPFTANFTNMSSGAISYTWDFGDGASATGDNPTHIYTVPGTYTVKLIATSGTGCSDTMTKTDYIRIKEPALVLTNLPQHGCVPVTITPGSTLTSNDPATSYLWNFGDGATSTDANPIHVYNAAGTYAVSLTITTSSGCTTTTTVDTAVKVGMKPNAAFTAVPTDVCAAQAIQFTDNSTGNVDQWFWQFGDGITSTVQNPHHTYEDVGIIPVILVVWSNGCADTITHTVTVRPPVASFRFTTSCTDKYTVNFIDQSLGALSWYWKFGDSTVSTEQSPTHVYSAPGIYYVWLLVSNNICVYSTQRTVVIVD